MLLWCLAFLNKLTWVSHLSLDHMGEEDEEGSGETHQLAGTTSSYHHHHANNNDNADADEDEYSGHQQDTQVATEDDSGFDSRSNCTTTVISS